MVNTLNNNRIEDSPHTVQFLAVDLDGVMTHLRTHYTIWHLEINLYSIATVRFFTQLESNNFKRWLDEHEKNANT